jgi:hypothetical protein
MTRRADKSRVRGAALPRGLALAALLIAGRLVVAAVPAAPAYRVIVHPANPVTSIERAFIAQALLRKVRTWPAGPIIEPVDLRPDSATRRALTEEVLGRSVSAVSSYWQQMIFSGRGLPPTELDTDAQVVDYVLHRPGALGYVSSGAELRGAKVLVVR